MKVPPGKEIDEIRKGDPEEQVIVTKRLLRLLLDLIEEAR